MYMYIQHLIELIIDTTCYHHEGQILIFDGQGSACLMVRTLWSDPRLIDDKIPMCVCACACSQAKYRMSCMVNIWWWFTRLNFWMKFMSLREILVMFVCDMPMFVGQTFVGEISYIYIYVWGWVKTYHYHGRVSTSWTFMNQLCKGGRVPRFWPIASHNHILQGP